MCLYPPCVRAARALLCAVCVLSCAVHGCVCCSCSSSRAFLLSCVCVFHLGLSRACMLASGIVVRYVLARRQCRRVPALFASRITFQVKCIKSTTRTIVTCFFQLLHPSLGWKIACSKGDNASETGTALVNQHPGPASLSLSFTLDNGI